MNRIEEILEIEQEYIEAAYIAQLIHNSVNIAGFISNAYLGNKEICNNLYDTIVEENILLMFLAESFEEYEIAASMKKTLFDDCKIIHKMFKSELGYKHTLKAYKQNIQDLISNNREFYLSLINMYQEDYE